MIIRAVDWWQPTRRQFGYRDKNTAQTRNIWVSFVLWFALKTKGANEASVGIGLTLVGSKNNEGTPFPWVLPLYWFPQEQERRTTFDWVLACRIWFAAQVTEEATTVWVSVTFLASSKLLLAKPRTQVEHDWSFQKQRASVYTLGIERVMACSKVSAETAFFWVSVYVWSSQELKRQRSRNGYRMTPGCLKSSSA